MTDPETSHPDDASGPMITEADQIERADLVEILFGLLSHFEPLLHENSYLRGMEILLELDERAGLEALGHLRDFDGGEMMIQTVPRVLGVDPAAPIPHPNGCSACDTNVLLIEEFAYMLRADVWPDLPGLVCIGCVENALGRELVREDFNWSVPLSADPDWRRSERLLDRMGRSSRGA